MRIPLGKLLGRSPFGALGALMDKVVTCCNGVHDVIEALIAGDQDQVVAHAKEVSRRECAADEVKNEIRDRLPSTLFLPVDRRDLLELVAQMDAIADCAEDVGVLLTLRPLEVPEAMVPLLRIYLERVMATVDTAAQLIRVMEGLLASGFGGNPADQARALIHELARKEHEADKIQDQIAKMLFHHEDRLAPVAIFMWTKVLNKIGDMANHAENVGDRIRLFLAR